MCPGAKPKVAHAVVTLIAFHISVTFYEGIVQTQDSQHLVVVVVALFLSCLFLFCLLSSSFFFWGGGVGGEGGRREGCEDMANIQGM